MVSHFYIYNYTRTVAKIQNLIPAAKLPPSKYTTVRFISKQSTVQNIKNGGKLPNYPHMAFCKSVDEGSSRHFSLHYIYSSVNPPKKKSIPHSLTSRTRHRNFPSPSLRHPRPPYQNIAAVFFPAAYLTHLETTPSSTGAPPHRTIPAEPQNHTLIQLSFPRRLSCGLVHPTGAALPTPSSSAPDLANQLHLNLFTDVAVHEPDLLHRRRHARVFESYNKAHPSYNLFVFMTCCHVLQMR